MRFWDASALVPLVVEETTSPRILNLLEEDPHLLVFWVAEVEIVSALARLEREGALDSRGYALALARLRRLKAAWHELLPTEEVREMGLRALRVHPLRTLDALHLGAALVASGGRPSRLAFVCLDSRLRQAAEREGFTVLP